MIANPYPLFFVMNGAGLNINAIGLYIHIHLKFTLGIGNTKCHQHF